MKCAIVIGHEEAAQGAANGYSKITEWQAAKMLAFEVHRSVKGVEIEVVERDPDGYDELPQKINALSPDFIISLHCNAFDGSVSGSEVLCWHTSEKGQRLAGLAQRKINCALRNRNRGVKLVKNKKERGALLLRKTDAPCIIVEPFFIDNVEELGNALKNWKELTTAIARTIVDYSQDACKDGNCAL